MRRTRVLVGAAVCLVVLAAIASIVQPWRPTIFSRSDPQTRAILSNPDAVDAYRIVSIKEGEEGEESLIPPRKTRGPYRISALQVQRLQNLTHGFVIVDDGDKACIPSPGVEFEFTRGAQKVDLTLCFMCAEAQLMEPSGKLLGHADFGYMRAELLTYIKSIFPNDPEIQKIDEDGNGRELEGRPGERPPNTTSK